jgi:hypothetical protein
MSPRLAGFRVGNIDAAQFDAKPLAFADRTSVAPVAHDFEDAIKRLVFTGGGSRITGEAPRLCRSTTDTSA